MSVLSGVCEYICESEKYIEEALSVMNYNYTSLSAIFGAFKRSNQMVFLSN